MQKFITLYFVLLTWAHLPAQTTANFDHFGLSPGAFLNGSDGAGGFTSGHVFLPNTYNAAFMAWSGWAISATTDTLTPGFNNQYSAIAGGGYEGSAAYAVSYASPASILKLEEGAGGSVVEGLYITNSAYAYLSMLDGDNFAKKFGGETGDDLDFFRLTVKKYLDGELGVDSVDFYLADYRFTDNSQDYIIRDWTYLDLSSLGEADSLSFALASSDVGQFGMNTPAYFCVDNITTRDAVVSTTPGVQKEFSYRMFPNPTTDFIIVDWEESKETSFVIFDASGRKVREFLIRPGQNRLDLGNLPRGAYFLKRIDSTGLQTQMVLKL